MPQRLLLGNGTEHVVGEPVEVTEAAEAAEVQIAAEAEPAITPCVTAFTVYLMDDGHVLLGETAWADPQPGRKPTFDEIYHGAAVIKYQVETHSWREPNTATEGCVTAFTPYYTHDGRWLISADPNDPLVVDREPTGHELIGGLAVVLRDVHTQEILQPVFNQFAQSLIQGVTQNVIGNMINLGKQAQDAQEAAKVAEQLEADKQRRAGRRG